MNNVDQLAIENAAAISAVLHQHPEYGNVYHEVRDDAGGFTGLWLFCARTGRVLAKLEEAGTVSYDGALGWSDVVDNFVESLVIYILHTNKGHLPDLLTDVKSMFVRAATPGCNYEEETA